MQGFLFTLRRLLAFFHLEIFGAVMDPLCLFAFSDMGQTS